MLTIIDPTTKTPFPSTIVAGRTCYAVPEGARFAVVVDPTNSYSRREVVLAVDGRDTLTNRNASPDLPGIVVVGRYVCAGFRISEQGVCEFVCSALGQGHTTAERNGTPSCAGLIAAVVYREAQREVYRGGGPGPMSYGGGVMRGATRGGGDYLDEPTRSAAPVSRGSVGAAAGQFVESRVGTTSWTRDASSGQAAVIEYDTFEGWAARGVIIPRVNMANPWPGQAPRFAASESL